MCFGSMFHQLFVQQRYEKMEASFRYAGAIYWAGIRTVVYGCSAKLLGKIAGGAFVIPCREIFVRGQEETLL